MNGRCLGSAEKPKIVKSSANQRRLTYVRTVHFALKRDGISFWDSNVTETFDVFVMIV